MTNEKIAIIAPPANYNLARQAPGQPEPQRAYLDIIPMGRLALVAVDSGTGESVPEAVYHGRHIRIWIPGMPVMTAFRDYLMGDEAQALLARVVDGWAPKWAGNSNVGMLNYDAFEARHLLEECILEGIVCGGLPVVDDGDES